MRGFSNRLAALTLICAGIGSLAWIVLLLSTMEISHATFAEKLGRILGYPLLLTAGAMMLPVGIAWLVIVERTRRRTAK